VKPVTKLTAKKTSNSPLPFPKTILFRKSGSQDAGRLQFDEALEQLPVLMCIRVDGVPGFRLNACVEQVLGWNNQDAQSDSFLEKIFPDETLQAKASKYLQSENLKWRDFPCRTKSGETVHIAWRTVDLGDGTYMGIGLEFSDLKAREEDLETEKQRALSLNQAKSELIANVSHEILNPLNSIMGFAEILESELEDNFHRGCASTIRENGRFLKEIMNDLMDVTRIESGGLPLLLEAVDPWEIIQSVRQLMLILARDKDLPLHIERDEQAPESILTDPKRLRQILINLVGNGIKFTETGSITIRLGPVERDEKEFFSIEVIDTGIGIPSEEMDRLFEAFVQGSNHTSAGAGLGLSICRKLSQHLGGDLLLRSKVQQGSTFTLKLPVLVEEI
jgi:signal transduction histidine kinase